MKVEPQLLRQAETLAQQGKTPLLFGLDGRLLGLIAVADTIKDDSPQAVRELQNMGLRVVMLTGDNRRAAEAIGRAAGVDAVIAEVLPEEKEAVIRSLRQQGVTMMVGDGINDAPALTSADVGAAIGAGTDVAIDAAGVVLMKSRLSDVSAAVRLSRAVLRNIHENLFWAFIYNVIGIPLAAGVWIPIFGWTLEPMFGALAMSLSSFCVVTNSLRLNLLKVHDASHDRRRTPVTLTLPERNQTAGLEKLLTVEGMMCSHCERTVRQALEAVPGVREAAADAEAGTALVLLDEDVPDDILKKAVEAEEYTVINIQKK